MNRLDAKVKVSTILSNYARRPRGRSLATGTADRVTDRVLASEAATAALSDLDPNDGFEVSSFVRRFPEVFSGRPTSGRTGRPAPARSREETEERFAEDVLSLVGEEPVLLSEVVDALRGGRSCRSRGRSCESGRSWRNVREDEVERVLRDFGAHLRSRRYGSGRAIYVATAPFETVVDYRHGKTRAVTDY